MKLLIIYNKFKFICIILQYKKKKRVGVFPIHELWMDIGDHGSFINAQSEINQEW